MLNHFASDVYVNPILQNALCEPIYFQIIYFFSQITVAKNKSW